MARVAARLRHYAKRLASGLLPAHLRQGLSQLPQLERLAELDRLAALGRLDDLDRLGELDRLVELERLGQLDRLSGLARLDDLQRLDHIEREMDRLAQSLRTHDSRLDALRAALGDETLDLRRPVYGVAGADHPDVSAWLSRCRTVEHFLDPVGDLRILDIGSSGGYVSCYFAARGATVAGWEPDLRSAEVARTATAVNGLPVRYFSADTATDIAMQALGGDLDVALILGPGPDLDEIACSLVAHVPVVVIATDADPPELGDLGRELDLAIDKVGRLDPGPGAVLWALRRRRDTVMVNGRAYPYDSRTSQAYVGSPMPRHGAGRRYYFSRDHVVKEYQLDGDHGEVNRNQILNEIGVLSQLRDHRSAPRLVDYELVPARARLVVERIPGRLVSDLLDDHRGRPDPVRVLVDVLSALASLERNGLHHNDVRSWNVIDDGQNSTLIDYGLVSNIASEVDTRSLLWVLKAVLTGEREDFDPRAEALPARHLFAVDPTLEKVFDAISGGETSPNALLQIVGRPLD